MKGKAYSLRMESDMHAELKRWADQENRKVANLIVCLLGDALAERHAATYESGLPVSGSQHRPTPEDRHASPAESAS